MTQDTRESPADELENLAAFRPDETRQCGVCGASPVVSATGLCGPCTWGESDTAFGGWWSDVDEERYQALTGEAKP